MLGDIFLLLGVFSLCFGVVKIVVLVLDRTSPLLGIVISAIGGAMIGAAYLLKGRELQFYDIPNAIYRIIGALN